MSRSIESYGDLSSFCYNVGLDAKKLVSINQVHSSKIISVKHAGKYDSSDGIINIGGNLVCSIKVADCLPIYFINRISRTIGLVHAGWRGLSLGIINEYINNVKKNNERASDKYDIKGPSIKK